MNARLETAVRLQIREQYRRPLVIALLVVVPVVFITRSIARTSELPRRITLPGGTEVRTTMRDIHGVTMASVTVAFLAALLGAFVVNASRQADARLAVSGFRCAEVVIPRLVVLGMATVFVTAVSVGVTAFGFHPQSWVAFTLGTLTVGLTYAALGALAGAVLGPLGSTYLALFAAMLGQGIVQSPMFGSGAPSGIAVWLPDHAATRIVIAGGFAPGFSAWVELAVAGAWIAGLVAAVVVVLRRALMPR